MNEITRHMYDIPSNNVSIPLCHNLLTGGALIRQCITNVNCPACLDLYLSKEKCPECRGTGRIRNLLDEYEICTDCVDGYVNVPRPLPIHRTEAGYPNCSTCDGGGCYDCTDPA